MLILTEFPVGQFSPNSAIVIHTLLQFYVILVYLLRSQQKQHIKQQHAISAIANRKAMMM